MVYIDAGRICCVGIFFLETRYGYDIEFYFLLEK